MEIPPLVLSREALGLKRSVMRDLLAVTIDPQVISFAGGLPASELLPTEAFRQCLDNVLTRDGPRAMQYSPQHGPLRDWIAGYMASRGVVCEPDRIFIVNGAQQGLSILSRLFLDPGESAVIEAVTFTGIQQVTVGHQVRVRTVPTDLTTGVDVDALEAAFREEPRPRLAILIPDFHNPLSVSLSAKKRARVAALAIKYGVPVVEDDPYSPLRFTGDPLPPVKAYDEAGFVFHLGSFSKILAPAVRLGWIVAPGELVPQITVLRESIDLESSTLIQRAVSEYLALGLLESHLERLNAVHRQRCQVMLEALRNHLDDVATWTEPQGGLFVWVILPEAVDTWDLFALAVERKVAYIPGGAFAVEGGHDNTMRLSFGNVRPEAIQEGVARLAEVIRERL